MAVLFATAINSYPQKKKAVKADTVTQVSFESFSRMRQTQIAITPDSFVITTNTGREAAAITKAQWNKIKATLKAVKLAKIPSLVSPTHNREFDGAMHCRITVSTIATQYESQYFDDGRPVKPLQALYDEILALQKEFGKEERK